MSDISPDEVNEIKSVLEAELGREIVVDGEYSKVTETSDENQTIVKYSFTSLPDEKREGVTW
jgi:hypothetical protein